MNGILASVVDRPAPKYLVLLLLYSGCHGYWPRDNSRDGPFLCLDTCGEHSVDGSSEFVADGPPDAPADAEPEPDAKQGTSCTDVDVYIASDVPPGLGGKVTLTITAPGVAWPMAGVTAVQNPSTKDDWQDWKKVTASPVCPDAGSTGCIYLFHDVPVPALPGPYTFGFLKEAAQFDPNAGGKLTGHCMP